MATFQPQAKYETFEAFWPFYLSQHQDGICRKLHVIGTTAAIFLLVYLLWTQQFAWIWLCFFCGYFFAWIGHFVFEKNRPATFTYPKWSFCADFKMLKAYYRGTLNEEFLRYGIDHT